MAIKSILFEPEGVTIIELENCRQLQQEEHIILPQMAMSHLLKFAENYDI